MSRIFPLFFPEEKSRDRFPSEERSFFAVIWRFFSYFLSSLTPPFADRCSSFFFLREYGKYFFSSVIEHFLDGSSFRDI